ncbi:MAG TPA: glutathione peroxidase [Candidatus Deferrimicrobiaceae bacterium]
MGKGLTVRRKARSPLFPLVCSAILLLFGPDGGHGADAGSVDSFYDLKIPSLEGDIVDLASYRGKVTLVVNVASQCGYTPQYTGLEKLHRELSGKGFSVLGFPSNDFGGQEPGTAKEIRKFCSVNYDVTFPVFEKVVTRKGASQSPAFAFLGRSGKLPGWNFSKYVVGKDGQVAAFFPSQVAPESPELRAAIDKALAAPPR